MTYTLQELEALCADAERGPWEPKEPVDGVMEFHGPDGHVGSFSPADTSDEDLVGEKGNATIRLIAAASTAIPELIARIKELDPAYNAKPPPDSVARATDLMREAAEKRAKLKKALADAGLGDASGLDALGLEASTDDAGDVKIRQKKRDSGNVDPLRAQGTQ